MRDYEAMVIFDPTLEAEQLEDMINRFTELIKKNGGEPGKIDRWGKRKLSYELKGQTEGIYAIFYFKGDNATVMELDRTLKITEGVMRFMTVRLESRGA